MKQHITMDQLRGLDNISNNRLRDFFSSPFVPGDSNQQCYRLTGHEYESGICKICFNPSHEKKKSGDLLLSIGQMIEFLSDTGNNFWISYDRNPMLWSYTKGKTPHPKDQNTVPEICDTLWEAVKEVLEKG